MQEERLPKLIMEWIPEERRKRGRPRKTWMEGVRAAMKTRHLEADQWLTERNGVWVPDDGDSCHKTGKVNRFNSSSVSDYIAWRHFYCLLLF
jgi:hypothetical protein